MTAVGSSMLNDGLTGLASLTSTRSRSPDTGPAPTSGSRPCSTALVTSSDSASAASSARGLSGVPRSSVHAATAGPRRRLGQRRSSQCPVRTPAAVRLAHPHLASTDPRHKSLPG